MGQPGFQAIADRLEAAGRNAERGPVEEPETLHEGCECDWCGQVIEDEEDGESTPAGSMHAWCAVAYERKNPQDW